jgi:NADH-quinone oxidoreductase subunit E
MAIFEGDRLEEARRVCARYPEGRERSAILPLLYLAQSVEGHVSREGLREVAEVLGLQTAEVEAVATFYTMLRLRPSGRHVLSICTNLSCAVLGGRALLARAREVLGPGSENVTPDGAISLHEEECLGACDAAPVVQIDFANHDRVGEERLLELIEALRRGEVPQPARGRAPADFREASRTLAGLGSEA